MWSLRGKKSDTKPTGYWRQEKDAEGKTTRIFELMDDGSEVETGYKHAYDDSADPPMWISIVAIVLFPVWLIATIWELWRYRK